MKFLDKLLGRKPAAPDRTVINHEEQAAPAEPPPPAPAAESAPAPAPPDADTI